MSFFRLALSVEQAEALDVLDAEGKAEADAIPVPVLDGWLREGIEAVQDSVCRAESEAKQESERERLGDVIREKLADLDGGAR